MDDQMYTSDMIDEFHEGSKYSIDHIRFDHNSMFMKENE